LHLISHVTDLMLIYRLAFAKRSFYSFMSDQPSGSEQHHISLIKADFLSPYVPTFISRKSLDLAIY